MGSLKIQLILFSVILLLNIFKGFAQEGGDANVQTTQPPAPVPPITEPPAQEGGDVDVRTTTLPAPVPPITEPPAPLPPTTKSPASITDIPEELPPITKTMVFLRKETYPGQDVFMRGGSMASDTLSIIYVPREGDHYFAYNAWAVGDTKLDWEGAEDGQGDFQGKAAQGSPMAWTSNNPSSPGYLPENTYGDHYWMWEVSMDCSQTKDGYFEFKGYLDGQWESDIHQSTCSELNVPEGLSQSNNHIARCGYKNVFEWNSNSCSMEVIPQ